MKPSLKTLTICLSLVLPQHGGAQSLLDGLLQDNDLAPLLKNSPLDLGSLLGNGGAAPGQPGLAEVLRSLEALGQSAEVSDLLSELGLLRQAAPNSAPSSRVSDDFDDVAKAREIAIARSCKAPFVVPVVDDYIRDFIDRPFGEFGNSLPQMRGLINFVVAGLGNDPCGLRSALLIKAALAVFDGQFTDAREIFAELLPDITEEQGATSLILQLVDAVVLSLQQRNTLALERMEALRAPILRTFGAQSRMALMVEGGIIDVRLQAADAARVAGLPERQENPYLQLLTDAEALHARIKARLGDADELTCLSRSTQASIQMRLGEAEVAKLLLQDLLGPDAICDKGGFLSVWPRHNLGRTLLHLGELAEARQVLDQTERQLENQRAPGHPLRVANTRALAEVALLEGRTDEALTILDGLGGVLSNWQSGEIAGVSSHAQRRRIVGLQAAHQNLAILIALAAPDNPAAQTIAAQSVLLFKGKQAEEDATLLQAMRDNRNLPLVEEITKLRSDLATAQWSGAANDSFASQAAIDRTAAKLVAAETQLGQQYPTFWQKQSSRNVTVSDVQTALIARDEGTLVEFRKVTKRPFGALATPDLPAHWVALVVDPTQVRTVDLGPAASIEAILSQLRAPSLVKGLQLENKNVVEVRNRFLRLLHESLVAPLALPDERPIFLAPEAELGLVPFFALAQADGTAWMAKRRAGISIIESGRALIAEKDPPAASSRMLTFADIDYGQPDDPTAVSTRGLNPLAQSAAELDTITRAAKTAGIPVDAFAGQSARKEVLTGLAAAPLYLHIATHGFSDRTIPEADRPSALASIAFSDANLALGNALSALEAQSLNLSGTQLVTLSACDTALGVAERGEGIHSMARAFRLAGANYVIVSRREVHDTHGRVFMEEFYQRLFADPEQRVAEAFAETIVHFSQTQSTIDWPAFTLVGNSG